MFAYGDALRDCAGQLHAALAEYDTAKGAEPPSPGWQPISTAPHNKNVLVAYRNKIDKWRIVKACYYEDGTLPWDENELLYDALGADDEAGDYAPAGWYEQTEVHDHVLPTDEKPTHWQPLPQPPHAAPEDK